MGIGELFLLAAALAMDAFAVSVCKGLAAGRVKLRHMLLAGIWFGGFQALMPLLGYLLGSTFAVYMERFSDWIAFGLLALIGGNMIREALSGGEESTDNSFGFRTMLLMAVATSIDALAVGITFSLRPVNIPLAVGMIGAVTFILSAAGVKIGSVFGDKYQNKAKLAGGIVLVLLGVKMVLSHYGILPPLLF